jgi:hypothetical protein
MTPNEELELLAEAVEAFKVTLEQEGYQITGTITRTGYGGYTETVSLNVPKQIFTAVWDDFFTELFQRFLDQLRELEQILPFLLVAVGLIAVFTLIKREVRL